MHQHTPDTPGRLFEDTIVAISTPPGRGGIGIVRLSGSRAQTIAESMVQLARPLEAGRARFGHMIDLAGDVLDEIVVTFFAAPHSYTAEDVVEIAMHGSPVLLNYAVEQSLKAGARLAQPGEFTERAFLSGRLDLTQAEAVRDLIDASTLHQARIAAQQLGGALSRKVAPIKERLIGLIAGLEAGVDFAEDDIETMAAEGIITRLQLIESPLRELERSFGYGRLVHDGLRLAIVGRPNVGKSSLFNRLVERDRAIVTATPGTTRDLVTERVSMEGIPAELIDTAGLREAIDEAETIGITKSREAIAEADLVLMVVDGASEIHPEDTATIASIADRPMLVAANKCDLGAIKIPLPTSARVVRTSATTGEGIAELRQAILKIATKGTPPQETALVTNLRQRQAVLDTLAALEHAVAAVRASIPHEMILLDLYEALSALDRLTGATTADDILHLIFSSFCIGK
ncbi:tRNA uridine-5-carboxymethylaminomethyl(34) synthesis GTPase MnmE [Edaphobacter albus]|uniref:tRNA uridine-5-carboxymethylaminomethyl(34) synthesis GTPase MnmE n=1 Tax=Edaphobacter sp. 4G125 TaxID=2763071 RepID=UPI001647CD57|nr:tRNA uridine-5-carboxymethylaminomethyl(34) synthesis GTPase MnmE [Edaphobacter sp. 4G125]QNI37158.1 tRNA uridine-5-carboxymethylaminomethyl(34) synthesis GTPase MnmE [Edaphobacter sp. 4G125]